MPKKDTELDECCEQLEAAKAQLAAAPPAMTAAADGDPVPQAAAVNPLVVIAIIDTVLKLIERFRKK